MMEVEVSVLASEHEEIDPIKSNPASHKAIGVVVMLAILIGLGIWLRGSPFSNCGAECKKAETATSDESCPKGMEAAPEDGAGGAGEAPRAGY